MNSYNLGIEGSWLLLILLLLVSAGLALYSYSRTVPVISGRKRLFLVAIRTIALGLLIFAIFNPILNMILTEEKEPKLAVLLDNSVSAGFDDYNTDRSDDYKSIIEKLNFSQYNNNITYRIFDENVRNYDEFAFDSLDFDGNLTNISVSFSNINRSVNNENIRSILLISDGAFNSGENPLYKAEQIGIPVFTVGIGDTNETKDIAISGILTNEIAYINEPIPVNINLTSTGFNDIQAELTLFENGNEIAKQQINLNSDMSEYSAVFEYLPKNKGMVKLSAKISPLDGEQTTKNNVISEFVDVRENKLKIAVFSGSPSADLKFFMNEMKDNESFNTKSFVQKINAEFYDKSPTQDDFNGVEIIVLIGFPIKSTSDNILDMIQRSLSKGRSLLFIPSKETDYRKLSRIAKYLPFDVLSGRDAEYNALLDLKPEKLGNPILRIKGTEDDMKIWNNLPPVFKTEVFVKPKPESEVLATIKVNNVAMNEPFLITRSFLDQKSVSILGYGLFRWKLLAYAAEVAKNNPESIDAYSYLMNNIIKWLSTENRDKLLTIKTSKKYYDKTEEVIFNAQVYDANLNPVDNSNVSLSITSGSKEERNLKMQSLGNGLYIAKVTGLPENEYAFSGKATLFSSDIGRSTGKFSVGESPIEYQNLKMNSVLLKEIAMRTGGKFFTKENVEEFNNYLVNSGKFKAKPITVKNEIAFWDFPWFLAVSLFLFSLEWFIRKRSGMV